MTEKLVSRPRWIAFDCYTTLMDREAGGVPAMERILGKAGGAKADAAALFNEWHHAVIRRYRTRFVTWKEAGRAAMFEIGERHGLPLEREAANTIYESMPDWPAHPDAEPVLSKLKRHFKIAIVTNMDTDLFRSTRLPVEFDGAVTSEMANAYKPHPAIFEYALRAFPCTRSELLWAGTAVWADVVGARLANLQVVWIKRPMGMSVGAVELEAWDPTPDFQFDGLHGLLDLLEVP
jgi:2-haloalkanoic acid dehalogenase type II